MKRTLSMILALLLVLSFASVLAEEETEMTTIRIMAPERGLENNVFANRDEYYVWQAAEKMFNEAGIDFEFEIIADEEQYKTTIQTRLASNYDLPDFCYLGTMDDVSVLSLSEQGILLSMRNVLETTKGAAYDYFFGGEGDTARNLISNEDGDFFWLPRIQINELEGKRSGTSMSIMVRSDWLEKLNMDPPSTLDEFTAYLRACQEQDMNGNGEKDEVAYLDTSKFTCGLNYWFGMVTDYVGVNITNQTVESPWYSPYAKDYFAYIQSLVNEGLLYVDAIGSDTSVSQLRLENKVSACYGYNSGTAAESAMRLNGIEGASYVGVMPFAAVEGVEPFYSEETPYLVYLKFGVTNAAADKLEAIATMLDVIYSDEFIHLMDWGVEGVMYEMVDGEEVSLISSLSFSQAGEQRVSMADYLWRYFFPTVRHNERSLEIANIEATGFPDKAAYEYAANDWNPRTPNDNTGYYALSRTEETAVLDEYITDLETYSRELAANLSLGLLSLDDWDTYIQELNDLGLEEVLAVRQAQLDRFYGK